ncbi:MAG: hypothetical protein WA705_03150 [Candidatus Ozemobacteraceae bacterium]
MSVKEIIEEYQEELNSGVILNGIKFKTVFFLYLATMAIYLDHIPKRADPVWSSFRVVKRSQRPLTCLKPSSPWRSRYPQNLKRIELAIRLGGGRTISYRTVPLILWALLSFLMETQSPKGFLGI